MRTVWPALQPLPAPLATRLALTQAPGRTSSRPRRGADVCRRTRLDLPAARLTVLWPRALHQARSARPRASAETRQSSGLRQADKAPSQPARSRRLPWRAPERASPGPRGGAPPRPALACTASRRVPPRPHGVVPLRMSASSSLSMGRQSTRISATPMTSFYLNQLFEDSVSKMQSHAQILGFGAVGGVQPRPQQCRCASKHSDEWPGCL